MGPCRLVCGGPTQSVDNMTEIEGEIKPKYRLVCGKLMSRRILMRFDPTKNLQFYDKKSASVRQPLGVIRARVIQRNLRWILAEILMS